MTTEWQREVAIMREVSFSYDYRRDELWLRFTVALTESGGHAGIKLIGDKAKEILKAYRSYDGASMNCKPVWVKTDLSSVIYDGPCLV